MRALILVCLVAAANAAFTNFHQGAQPLVKRAVADFVAHLESGPGLAEFMGVPNNAFLESVEKATQTELGQQLSQQLSNVLAQIQSAIDHGQQVSQSLIEKAKELLKSLMAAGANVGQLAQQFLGELVQMGMLSLGNIFGKRELSGMINGLLSNVVGELQQALQNVIGVIQGVGNGSNRNIVSTLLNNLIDQVFNNLGAQLAQVVNGNLGILGGSRTVGDERIWNLITDSIQSIISSMSGPLSQFQSWISQIMGGAGSVLQGHMSNIQQMAQEVLGHVNELTSNTVDQAVAFFKPYQNDLGALWGQLQQAAANIHAQVTG